METDPIIKAVTGLMLAQQATSQSVVSAQTAIGSMQNAIGALQRDVGTLQRDFADLREISARSEKLCADLLQALTDFVDTSADTRKRVQALEADVAELKRKSA